MIPISQAAKTLGCSRQYIHAEIQKQRIPGARVQWGRWLIPQSWIRAKQKRKEQRNGR